MVRDAHDHRPAPRRPRDVFGTYHDGRSASDQRVRVRLEQEELVICDLEGTVLVRWPFADLHIAGGNVVAGALRLRRGSATLDRLTVADRDFIASLAGAVPHLREEQIFDLRRLRFVFGLMMTMMGTVGVLFFLIIPLFSNGLARVVPAGWESRVGTRIEKVMVQNYGRTLGRRPNALVCNGQVGRRALQKIIDRLEPAAGTPFPLSVTVLDIDTVNAFALPGGRIVVARGLFNFARTGDEVAAVLAHEITHVTARHPSRNVIEEGATAIMLNSLFGGLGERPLELVIGRMLISRRHSRGRELEADRGAVELMERAGLDARALATFLERISRSARSNGPSFTWLLTHPVSAQRAAAVRALARSDALEAPAPVLSQSEFMRLRLMCTRAQRSPAERLPRKGRNEREI